MLITAAALAAQLGAGGVMRLAGHRTSFDHQNSFLEILIPLRQSALVAAVAAALIVGTGAEAQAFTCYPTIQVQNNFDKESKVVAVRVERNRMGWSKWFVDRDLRTLRVARNSTKSLKLDLVTGSVKTDAIRHKLAYLRRRGNGSWSVASRITAQRAKCKTVRLVVERDGAISE